MEPPLRRYREARNETPEDVAKRLGMSAAYVRMIETGKRPLTRTASVKRAALAYLLPLDVFRALRAGRIGPATALAKSLDRKGQHVAKCCAAEAT